MRGGNQKEVKGQVADFRTSQQEKVKMLDGNIKKIQFENPINMLWNHEGFFHMDSNEKETMLLIYPPLILPTGIANNLVFCLKVVVSLGS